MRPMDSRCHRNMFHAVAATVLLSNLAGVGCECVDHPLYDAKANRWNGAYMGGGNSQTRPFPSGFRSVELAPAAISVVPAEQGVTIWIDLDEHVEPRNVDAIDTQGGRFPLQLVAEEHALRLDLTWDQLRTLADAHRNIQVRNHQHFQSKPLFELEPHAAQSLIDWHLAEIAAATNPSEPSD